MPYLIIILIAALLFFGFLLVTVYEQSRSKRFFASLRYRLDRRVERALFVVEHVDWGAFTAHLTRTTATTLAHDITHGTLVAVRATERQLTRAVRTLRSQRDDAAALPAPGLKSASAEREAEPAAVSQAEAPAPTPVQKQSPEPREEEDIIDAQSVRVVDTSADSTEDGRPAIVRRQRKNFDIRPPSKRK